MDNNYPSFVQGQPPQPTYDTQALEVEGYSHKARCNKDNPDCQQFIQDKQNEGFSVQTIELDNSMHPDGNHMTDIWVKE